MKLTVSAITIYPIKSCGGIALDAAKTTPTGFEHDREWLIVDQTGRFISQRRYPRMALIRPRLADNAIILTGPDMPDLPVPITASGTRRKVEVWGQWVDAIDQGDDAAQWLSTFLGRPCRLVHHLQDRTISEKYRQTGKETIMFADSLPFLVASQASLDDLNNRLDEPVAMSRFRPNIVVAGGTGFQEDNWKTLRISDLRFRLVKPCTRCEIITVNQETAVKEVEPMETLGSFRRRVKGIVFGQNAVCDDKGEIRVGDTVEVIDGQQ